MSPYLTGPNGQLTLEDEKGLTWKVGWIGYLQSGRRLALTLGWPEFVTYHNVKDGDVFLVEIVSPEHFMVQVIRSDVDYTKRSCIQMKKYYKSYFQNCFMKCLPDFMVDQIFSRAIMLVSKLKNK